MFLDRIKILHNLTSQRFAKKFHTKFLFCFCFVCFKSLNSAKWKFFCFLFFFPFLFKNLDSKKQKNELCSYDEKDVIMVCPLVPFRHVSNDIRVTRVSDTQASYAEIFTACTSKINIVSNIMMDSSLRKHSIILNLWLLQGRTVLRQDNQYRLPLTQTLESTLVSQGILSTLHNKSKTRVDTLLCFFLYRL